MRNTGLRTAALLTAIGLTLTGCGGAPEPPPPPQAQPSPTPTATPSAEPTAPPMPAKAREKSRAGAEAFVRYYIELINHAGRSGQTDALKGSSLRTCVKCSALIEGIDDVYEGGGDIIGGGWKVDRVAHYGFDRGYYFLDVSIDSAPQKMKPSAESEVRSFPGADNRLRAFVLERRSGRWKVSELDPSA